MQVFLEALPWIGALFGIYATVQCGIEVNRGDVQPRLASWIAWGTSNAVFSALAFMHGNYLSAGFSGMAALGNFGILALCAYRRAGTRPRGTTDFSCLIMTAACLLVIVLSQGAPYVAYIAMVANIVATWPTMKHAWRKPHEESWRMFAANSGANGLGLIGVIASGNVGIAVIAGPLVSMAGNLTLVGITIGRTWLAALVAAAEREIHNEAAKLHALFGAELKRLEDAAANETASTKTAHELVGTSS